MKLLKVWQKYLTRPVCPYCNGKDLSSIGRCNNCGYILPVKFSDSWPPKINRIPLAARTKVSTSQCYICGQQGQEFGAFRPKSVIDKMACEMRLLEPSGITAISLVKDLFSSEDPIIASCILCAQIQNEIILFPAIVNPVYAAEQEDLGLSKLNFCLECAKRELSINKIVTKSAEEILREEININPSCITEDESEVEEDNDQYYGYYEDEAEEPSEEELPIYNKKEMVIYNRR